MPFGRKSPLEALALPGVILAYKYSQFRQRRREAASRRVTERELSALHHKIDKLLNKLEESEPEPPTSQEDECVICINARATMQTSPCGHRVVCRRCFVKTIQSAVAQRLLPLRCVICRARVNRLTSSSGSWRIQESASSYSMGAKSWTSSSISTSPGSGVPQSASSYSIGDPHHPQHQQQQQHHHHHHHHNHHQHNHRHFNSNNSGRVAQSASLYSMSSGSSSLSNTSNITSCSNMSSISSGAESSSGSSMISGSSLINHPHLSLMNRGNKHSPGHQHNHSTCPDGCLGAIPRKPTVQIPTMMNTYPGRRYTKGRIADLQNRLPPIKEFKSPAKVPTPSPVHISNPRFRYASYTKSSSSHETTPLLKDPSPTRKSHSFSLTNSSKQATSKLGMTSKVAPTESKTPIKKNGLTSPKNSKSEVNRPLSSSKGFPLISGKLGSGGGGGGGSNSGSSSNSGNLHQDEKADNKKNETMEKKKKEEKLKLKAEKEARKEEKRLAKEEERLAKLLAKEEKKKNKREAKGLLLSGGNNDGNKK